MQQSSTGTLLAAFAIAQFWLAPLLAAAISAVYFRASPTDQPLLQRLVASGHGAAIAILYGGALAFSAFGISKQSYGLPFMGLLLVPVFLAGLSFALFRGRKYIHLLQILNLACLAWTLFIGGMAVTGEWL